MNEKFAIFLAVFAAGYCYVEASVPQPDRAVLPEPPKVVVPDTGAPDVGAPDVGSPATSSVAQYAFTVRQRDGNTYHVGTAISLGNGLLVTAAHVVPGRTYPEVEVNGGWQAAGFQRLSGADVAYLTIQDKSLPSVNTRQPVYGEAVTVFGLKTQRVMPGIVSDAGMVSLDSLAGGIDHGDSGGGVFSVDGSLVGLITAMRSSNSRVVMFESLNPPAPYSGPAVQSPQVTQAPKATPAPACTGPNCNIPQPRFRLRR